VPGALLDQLAIGGRLVIPVGALPHGQRLVRIVRSAGDEYLREELEAVAFVPLIGVQGWPEGRARR
jgi:protein-L-isoaspartate O-methyltransferase